MPELRQRMGRADRQRRRPGPPFRLEPHAELALIVRAQRSPFQVPQIGVCFAWGGVARRGRDPKGGQVLIQTYTPENPSMSLAALHGYAGFMSSSPRGKARRTVAPGFDVLV